MEMDKHHRSSESRLGVQLIHIMRILNTTPLLDLMLFLESRQDNGLLDANVSIDHRHCKDQRFQYFDSVDETYRRLQ